MSQILNAYDLFLGYMIFAVIPIYFALVGLLVTVLYPRQKGGGRNDD